MSVTKKTLIETIDVTPTWESMLPAMLEAIEAGGKRAAAMRLDFLRMARALDGFNQAARHGRAQNKEAAPIARKGRPR